MADIYHGPLSPHLVHRQRSRNCVVGRDSVGKARPSCYDLPPEDYVYGACESADASGQGVRDALVWYEPTPSPPKRPGVDYQRVNREAAKSHVTSPKALADFRADHDYRLSPPRPRHERPAVIPSDVIPGYAYGKTVEKPSPPMGDLLAHHFGRAAEEALDERYHRYDDDRARSAAKFKIKMTKAAVLQRRPPAPEPEDPMKLWKMKKFQRVPGSSPWRRQSDSTSPPPARGPGGADDGQRLSSSSSASLPELPQVFRTVQRSTAKGPTLEDALLATRLAAEPSDAERDTEAGSEASWGSEGDSGSGTPAVADGAWDEGQGRARVRALLEDENAELEAATPPQEVTPRPTKRAETLVKLLLTVTHELPEELNAAVHAMAGCIRSHFPDSFVRVREVGLEKPREGMRDEHSRYMAWGAGALRSKPHADAGKARVMSPVVLSLSVFHRSREELETAQRAIIERIRGRFPEGLVRVRNVRPPLPPAGAAARAGPPGTPGTPGTPGQQQVRFREEVSMEESPPLRYPLRPRTRDGQPRRSKAREVPRSPKTPPTSPWK